MSASTEAIRSAVPYRKRVQAAREAAHWQTGIYELRRSHIAEMLDDIEDTRRPRDGRSDARLRSESA